MWSIWNIICTLQTLYNGPVIVCLFTGTLLFDQFTLLRRKLIDSTLYPYCHTCCSTTMHYDLIPVLPQFRWVQAARHCRMLSREVETWNHHWGATGDWRSPTTSSSWKIASTKPGRTCSARHFGAAFRALLLRTTWSSIWYGIDLDAFKSFFCYSRPLQSCQNTLHAQWILLLLTDSKLGGLGQSVSHAFQGVSQQAFLRALNVFVIAVVFVVLVQMSYTTQSRCHWIVNRPIKIL
jgi:hypothetical protein